MDELVQQYKNYDMKCVCFSKYKKHNTILYELIKNINPSINTFIFNGDTQKKIDVNVFKTAQKFIIFTTYSLLSTGIDIETLNTLVIAIPTKNKFEQVLGRIF